MSLNSQILKNLEAECDEIVSKLVILCSLDDSRISGIDVLDQLAEECFRGKIFPILSASWNITLPEEPFNINLLIFKSRKSKTWYQTLVDKCKSSTILSNDFSQSCITNSARGDPHVTLAIKSHNYCIRVNDIDGVYKTAIFEECNRIVGADNLLKRSCLFIKAWIMYESQRFCKFPGSYMNTLLSMGALEVMILCAFSASTREISSPLTALLAFLEFFSKFNWTESVVTMCGDVKKKNSDVSREKSYYSTQFSDITTKYQKILDSNISDNVESKAFGSVSEPPYLAITDLLVPNKYLSFNGVVSQETIAAALSQAFSLGYEDMMVMGNLKSSFDDVYVSLKKFPNLEFTVTEWHSRPKVSADKQILNTPPKYVQEVLSLTEFICFGKITGEEIVRIAAQTIKYENRSLRVTDVISILQDETEHPNLSAALKSLGGFKRLVTAYPGILELGEDYDNTGNPVVFASRDKSTPRSSWFLFSPLASITSLENSFFPTQFEAEKMNEDYRQEVLSLRPRSMSRQDDSESMVSDSATTVDEDSPKNVSVTDPSFYHQDLSGLLGKNAFTSSAGKPIYRAEINPNSWTQAPASHAIALKPFQRPPLRLEIQSPAATPSHVVSRGSIPTPFVSPLPAVSTGIMSVPPGLTKSPVIPSHDGFQNHPFLNDAPSTIEKSPMYLPQTSIMAPIEISQNPLPITAWGNIPPSGKGYNPTNISRTPHVAGRDSSLFHGTGILESRLDYPITSPMANPIIAGKVQTPPTPKTTYQDPNIRRQTFSHLPTNKPSTRNLNLTPAAGATVIDPETGNKVFNPAKPEVWVPGKFMNKVQSQQPSHDGYPMSSQLSSMDFNCLANSYDESIRRPTFPQMSPSAINQPNKAISPASSNYMGTRGNINYRYPVQANAGPRGHSSEFRATEPMHFNNLTDYNKYSNSAPYQAEYGGNFRTSPSIDGSQRLALTDREAMSTSSEDSRRPSSRGSFIGSVPPHESYDEEYFSNELNAINLGLQDEALWCPKLLDDI